MDSKHTALFLITKFLLKINKKLFYLCSMENKIKRGPVQMYHFENYPIGHEIELAPLKQSSFKSMLSKFNKPFAAEQRHQYAYEQLKKNIIATRVR